MGEKGAVGNMQSSQVDHRLEEGAARMLTEAEVVEVFTYKSLTPEQRTEQEAWSSPAPEGQSPRQRTVQVQALR